MPRFVVQDHGVLELVQSPYKTEDGFRSDNIAGLSDRLRTHLRRYDRFYFPYEHGEYGVVDRFVVLKIAAAAYGQYSRGMVRKESWRQDSEALRVSRAIFDELFQKAAEHDRQFVLFVLPTEHDLLRLDREPDFQVQWDRLVDYVCDGEWQCIDLSRSLGPLEELDVGVDGTHFGPVTNRRMASTIHDALMQLASSPRVD